MIGPQATDTYLGPYHTYFDPKDERPFYLIENRPSLFGTEEYVDFPLLLVQNWPLESEVEDGTYPDESVTRDWVVPGETKRFLASLETVPVVLLYEECYWPDGPDENGQCPDEIVYYPPRSRFKEEGKLIPPVATDETTRERVCWLLAQTRTEQLGELTYAISELIASIVPHPTPLEEICNSPAEDINAIADRLFAWERAPLDFRKL